MLSALAVFSWLLHKRKTAYSTEQDEKMKMAVVSSALPMELRKWLESSTSTTFVIDCRPFLAFNEGHITTAHNVHCPPIVKRRSGGCISLANVIPCEKARQKLKAGLFSRVVVYDDSTDDLENLAKDSNLFLVLKSLQDDSGISTVHYLQGGYHDFLSSCPHLCTQSDLSNNVMLNLHSQVPSLIRTKYQKEPVEVLPFLYLGDAQHARQKMLLQRLGITALLNVSCGQTDQFYDTFTYKNIPVQDNSSANISVWFQEAIHFIDSVRAAKGRILVHCHAGISRSATMCLAYLMQAQHYALEDAYDYLKSRRSIISPNLNFMQQLLEFESQLSHGQRSHSQSDSSSSSSSSSEPTPLCPPLSISDSPTFVSRHQNLNSPCSLQSSKFLFDVPPALSPVVTPTVSFFGNSVLLSPS